MSDRPRAWFVGGDRPPACLRRARAAVVDHVSQAARSLAMPHAQLQERWAKIRSDGPGCRRPAHGC
jgi:hypothetical protein